MSQFAFLRAEWAAQPDTHDYSEAETRDYFIDLLLKEAGWALDQTRDRVRRSSTRTATSTGCGTT